LAVNELHGVKVYAPVHADEMDGHNVRVVQLRRRLRFVLEALQLPGIQRSGEGEHLQGHAPAEGDLLGLIDDAHAAAARFPKNAEVAQTARDGLEHFRRGAAQTGAGADNLQRPEDVAQGCGCLRVAARIFLDVGLVPSFLPLQEFIGHGGDERFQGRSFHDLHFAHDGGSSTP